MKTESRKVAIFGWALFALVTLSTLIQLGINLDNLNGDSPIISLAEVLGWSLTPIAFALVAALIVSRQPHNMIGWLLLCDPILSAFPVDQYINQFPTAPSHPGPFLLLVLWFSNWNWLLLIFPILFIPLLFPNGSPPSPRWRWLVYAGLGMCAFLIIGVTFSATLGPIDELEGTWSVANPIGFLDPESFPLTLWALALILMTILSFASLAVRYRRAGLIEREQIKWLLFASGLFAAIYIPSFFVPESNTVLWDVFSSVFPIALIAFPAAIGIAVLRYRLWDIDVIIRKALVYGALTFLLAMIYFGTVTLLQNLLASITGERSPLAVVLSTLAIAALFSPFRRKIQNTIDRRFYRRKYNADQAISAFNLSVRDEVDPEALSLELLKVIDDTFQPGQTSLWLREASTPRKSSRE